MRNEFKKRYRQLTNEINEIEQKINIARTPTSRTNMNNLTEEQRKLIIEYGSIENAFKAEQKIKEQKKQLQERQEALNKINKKERTAE